MRRCEEDDQYVNPPVAASILALCCDRVVDLALLPTERARYFPIRWHNLYLQMFSPSSVHDCTLDETYHLEHMARSKVNSFANRSSASTRATAQTKRGCTLVNIDGGRRKRRQPSRPEPLCATSYKPVVRRGYGAPPGSKPEKWYRKRARDEKCIRQTRTIHLKLP